MPGVGAQDIGGQPGRGILTCRRRAPQPGHAVPVIRKELRQSQAYVPGTGNQHVGHVRIQVWWA